jgi:hypothetical protein
MYEDIKFCEWCGAPVERRKTGRRTYDRRTGRLAREEWQLRCSSRRSLPARLFPEQFGYHARATWWEEAWRGRQFS